MNHENGFSTTLTSNQIAGVTTTPLDAIPSVDAPYYLALDATNLNGNYEIITVTSDSATNVNHAATTNAHTTSEEVRMVVTAAELDGFSDGWQPAAGTWTYASATTITVPSGAASLYQKGDKIKLTQTSDKYFYIVSVADELLTVTGGSDYTVANAAITAPYYSKIENPQGFPAKFSFTSTVGGFSDYASNTIYFKIKGSIITVYNASAAGTSDATTVTFSLPVTAGGDITATICGYIAVRDDGVHQSTPGYIYVSGTTATVYKSWFQTAFTATGDKRVYASALGFSYEF